MLDEFLGQRARYKTGLKPWGSRSGNTIPAVIPLSLGFRHLGTKLPEFQGRSENEQYYWIVASIARKEMMRVNVLGASNSRAWTREGSRLFYRSSDSCTSAKQPGKCPNDAGSRDSDTSVDQERHCWRQR
jgi:hypothetical protein